MALESSEELQIELWGALERFREIWRGPESLKELWIGPNGDVESSGEGQIAGHPALRQHTHKNYKNIGFIGFSLDFL